MGTSPYRSRFLAGTTGRDEEEAASSGGEKYFGLVNVKNTCYVNSVLQALYFCTPFRRRALQHLAEEREDDPGGGSLLASLSELFAQIEGQKKNVGCLTPRRFLARLRRANDLFCNSEHQDAHEFFQFLLNEIMEQAKKIAKRRSERQRQEALANGQATPSKAESASSEGAEDGEEDGPKTWVHDILQGYLVNQTKCLCCESVTVRRETFFDLSVDIEQHTSIAACLRAFESTERLRANNKFFCDTCACLQEAEKRLRIYQLPSVLTLHLKRFKYVERLGRCCRLPYRVVFPLQLRVVEHRPPPKRNASSPGVGGDSPGDRRNDSPPRPGKRGGRDSPEEEDASSSAQPPSRLFELRSVVVHIGRDSSYGHYVTVVRNGDRCVLLDDDVVRVVEPGILRSFYGSAGGSGLQGGGGGSGDRLGSSGGGWSGQQSSSGHAGGGGDRASGGPAPGAPYYEQAPEGTCCGYLLIYEAVDSTSADAGGEERTGSIDLSGALDWLSEDRNFSDSDNDGEYSQERPGAGASRPPARGGDGELTQAFEQRCRVGSSQSGRSAAGGAALLGSTLDSASLSRVNLSPAPSPIAGLEGATSVVAAVAQERERG